MGLNVEWIEYPVLVLPKTTPVSRSDPVHHNELQDFIRVRCLVSTSAGPKALRRAWYVLLIYLDLCQHPNIQRFYSAFRHARGWWG